MGQPNSTPGPARQPVIKTASGSRQKIDIHGVSGFRPRSDAVCLFSVFAILFWIFGASAASHSDFVPGQVLVKAKTGVTEAACASKLSGYGAAPRQYIPRLHLHVITVNETRAEQLLARLRRDPEFEYTERDGLARAAYVTNNLALASGLEWHLAKIKAPEAWSITAGQTNTIVALLDSGVNQAHPDLAGRVLPGYNFVANSSDTSDDFGHGTAVAGVVVAAGNNTNGVAGVSYGCMILPVKVVDATGFATYSAIAQGIHFAVDNGARAINLSIVGSLASVTLQNAVNYAWSNNVVVVAAAGNTGNTTPQYPAACTNVVAVSATITNDTLASFSSFGSFISLGAPGDDIWTTQRDLSNPYGSWRGTSFSSPLVVGTAALIASVNPSLSNSQIVNLLEQSADDLGPAGYDTSFGYGRLNAAQAVQAAYNQPPVLQPLRRTDADHVVVAWSAIPGRTYRLQFSPSLSAGSWLPLCPDVLAGSAFILQTDVLSSTNQRFYRVLMLP